MIIYLITTTDYSIMDYSTTTVAELKTELKKHSLKVTGKKSDLVLRLIEYNNKIKEERERFKVFIKTLSGSVYTVYTDPNDTVLELKEKIEEKIGIPVRQQRLYCIMQDTRPQIGDISYNNGTIGRQTVNENLLSDYGVHNESFFNLSIHLR